MKVLTAIVSAFISGIVATGLGFGAATLIGLDESAAVGLGVTLGMLAATFVLVDAFLLK